MLRRVALVMALFGGLAALASWGDSDNTELAAASAADSSVVLRVTHPEVTDASAERASNRTWTFRVTVASPYDTRERYADAWRVLAPDDIELDLRVLTHHHADEQPFTRSLTGVEIPADARRARPAAPT